MSDIEMIRYMFVSKATRRINMILEALRQTEACWLIAIVIIGLTICFFGHYLRRVLPFFIGLAFGFAVSCIVKNLVAGGGKITLDRVNSEITKLVNRIKELGGGYLKSIIAGSGIKTWILYIIGGLACACLGALLYRFTVPICLSVLIYTFASIFMFRSEHVLLYSICIAAVSFAVLCLFYNHLFILFSAAAGAAGVGFVIASTDSVAMTLTYIVAIALFFAGAVFQLIWFYKRRKRAKEKKKARFATANNVYT
ncbi:MAG: hypothetical protein K5663_05790 [Clostridiales bacterium]|nr:hypothetical protein [Clostridiales bacterium]